MCIAITYGGNSVVCVRTHEASVPNDITHLCMEKWEIMRTTLRIAYVIHMHVYTNSVTHFFFSTFMIGAFV